jgi:hypothetical protein
MYIGVFNYVFGGLQLLIWDWVQFVQLVIGDRVQFVIGCHVRAALGWETPSHFRPA